MAGRSWREDNWNNPAHRPERYRPPHERRERQRPNYFVSIQVNDGQIASNATRVQAAIERTSGRDLSELKVNPKTFHITLMVMCLQNQEQIDRTSQCLEQCVAAIQKVLGHQPRGLEFETLSDFNGGSVVFACLKSPGTEILQRMLDEVKRLMKESAIESTDPINKIFRPHLTLMKYDRKTMSSDSPNKIDRSWYQASRGMYFGCQTINSLQLCRMHGKGDDGYYFVDKEVPFI